MNRGPGTSKPHSVGSTETTSVQGLVEDALRLSLSARHEIMLERDFAEVPFIVVDQHRVLQILMNLLRNALHAIDSATGSDKRLVVRIRLNQRKVLEIVVQDYGVGISAQNLPHIFTRGFTTKKDGHGFGLHSGALAAIAMGGFLHGHSDGEGKGATFTLELPLKNP